MTEIFSRESISYPIRQWRPKLWKCSLNDIQVVYDYLFHNFYLPSPSDLILLNMFIPAVFHKTFANMREKK